MSRLVFDIGGTHLRMAIGNDGVLGVVRKIPTPGSPEGAVEELRSFLEGEGARLEDVVGGVAGIVREGVIIDSPNLSSWNGFAFQDALMEALSLPVQIENDAALAGLGEARVGAGKGHRAVAYLTIGTGVGGTLIAHGKIPHQSHEPGRMTVDGKTLESLVGGHALEAEFNLRPSELPREVYQERAGVLAKGIYACIEEWSPDIFILNGPLMNEENGFRLSEVEAELKRIANEEPMPPLVLAVLRDKSGLQGALCAP
jgi:predicted NBD/HSP70 family sugar kinase